MESYIVIGVKELYTIGGMLISCIVFLFFRLEKMKHFFLEQLAQERLRCDKQLNIALSTLVSTCGLKKINVEKMKEI